MLCNQCMSRGCFLSECTVDVALLAEVGCSGITSKALLSHLRPRARAIVVRAAGPAVSGVFRFAFCIAR
jgi:hypothetical protein